MVDERVTAEVELPPDAARTIEGLRDTGYEFATAVADIVDNSIEAGATNVDINVERGQDGQFMVTIADNGSGMSAADLINAMRYGSRARPSPSSLGKFGLGLKTASTAMCRRLSVLTRTSGDEEPSMAEWDLDLVASTDRWLLRQPRPTPGEMGILDRTARGGSGTVVFWRRVDRMLPERVQLRSARKVEGALKRQLDDLEAHLELTYCRFLVDGGPRQTVRMTLNGKQVLAWNPFAEDYGAECLYDQNIPFTVSTEGGDANGGSFRLRAFVLPPQAVATPAQKTGIRYSTNSQGFYVFRENRVISHGGWLKMARVEPHFSLLRVDLSFTHELDDALHIDVKKSHIELHPELREYIAREIAGPRRVAEQSARRNERQALTQSGVNDHAVSNNVISQRGPGLSQSTVELDPNGWTTVHNARGHVTIELPVISSPAGPHVVVQESLDDGLLWRPGINDKKKAVLLNAGHDFYRKVYLAAKAAPVTAQGLDFLLWALAEAELAAITDDEVEHMAYVRREVSRIVRELSKDLPEQSLGD